MNYGLQMATSGALTSLYRMDVLANNLANVGTVGFKPDLPAVRQRDTAKVEDGLSSMSSNSLLERLGGGVMSAPNYVQFDQGPLTRSESPFDVGIQGDGFFVMRDEAATGKESLRLSRDGRFTRDAQGRLVSATTGFPVLDPSGRPITLRSDAPVDIQSNGTIKQGGEPVGQIRLVDIGNRSRLGKLGLGMFSIPAEDVGALRPATGQIEQHFVEGSAVDPITALMQMTDASRAAEGSFSLIRGHDRMLDRAINGLGRIT